MNQTVYNCERVNPYPNAEQSECSPSLGCYAAVLSEGYRGICARTLRFRLNYYLRYRNERAPYLRSLSMLGHDDPKRNLSGNLRGLSGKYKLEDCFDPNK